MKIQTSILFLAAAMAVGLTFTACNNDDDDEGGSGGSSNTSAGQLDDRRGNHELPEGYRILSVGNYRYYYENGRLSQFYADGEYVDFSTKGITIAEDLGSIKITFNGKGLISKMTYSSKGSDGDFSWDESETETFSYNSNDQCTSISGSWKENGSEYGSSYSESGSGNYEFSYTGTVIKKIVMKSSYSGRDEDGKYSGSDNYTYTFDFDRDYENIYGQWTPKFLDYILDIDDVSCALAYAGCFGRATSMLPTTIYETSVEIEDGERHEDEDSYSCSYSFNAYGALRQADGTSYTYTTISNDNYVKATRAAEDALLRPFAQQPRKASLGFFSRHIRK